MVMRSNFFLLLVFAMQFTQGMTQSIHDSGNRIVAIETKAEKGLEKERKFAQKYWRERLKRPINGVIFSPDSLLSPPDSLRLIMLTRAVHFMDSLKSGKLNSLTESASFIAVPQKIRFNYHDPFDPYANAIFFRYGQGKFWFFGLGILLSIILMYFRSAYPRHFELRIKSIFNIYYFNELVNDQNIVSSKGGASVVFALSQAVFASGVMLSLIFRGYLELNHFIVFAVVYLGIVIVLSALQLLQLLFASSLYLEEVNRRQIQRQLNMNFVLSLLYFPIFIVVYYNGYKLPGADLSIWISFMLVLWIVTRLIFVFIGLFQDRQLTLLSILYFCTLEILPYTVLFTMISRI